MTDYSQLSDDQLNRMVAEMLGWKKLPHPATPRWQRPSANGTECIYNDPDYLHDPVALEDVKRWVEDQGMLWFIQFEDNSYKLSVGTNDLWPKRFIPGAQPTEAKAWCIAALMLKDKSVT